MHGADDDAEPETVLESGASSPEDKLGLDGVADVFARLAGCSIWPHVDVKLRDKLIRFHSKCVHKINTPVSAVSLQYRSPKTRANSSSARGAREQDGVLNGKFRVFVLFGRLLHNQFKASRYK